MEKEKYKARVNGMSRKEQMDFLLNRRDEPCSVCKYNHDCNNGGVRGGSNGPIYPPCADKREIIDDDKLSEACVEIMIEEGERMSNMVVELCPNCETEIEMRWSVEEFGYKAYCPVCGNRLMLCDECMHRDEALGCDYNSHTDTCRFNRGEITVKRRKELYANMLNHLTEMVSGCDLRDTLHAIGFTDSEIEIEGIEISDGDAVIPAAEETR